jgi:hypothetical protein
MCLISFINNFGVDVLPDKITEQLKDIIIKDSDIATRRNAYLLLAKINIKESLLVTKEILQNTEINELADLFALAIVENMKNLCHEFPREKSKFIKILLDLSNHKSHSVLFEIGNSIIELSTNPNTIRNAVNILCNLLVEQKDNNTLVIILKKLIEIKNKYKEILEEQILSFAIILDSNCTNELRKLLFELISELIKESNISRVFEIFISDFNKLKSVTETDSTIEFKNMILSVMHKNIRKYSNLPKTYPLFVLEKSLLYDSKGSFIDDQVMILKDLFFIFSLKNRDVLNDFLNKIINNFEDINNPDILQSCLWILAEYSSDLKTIKKVVDLIMKNIGDLNLTLLGQSENSENTNKQATSSKKTITKTVILPDGTYGTESIVVDAAEFNRQKEMKYLRKFLLETNFFFATNLIVTLSRMIVNIYYLEINNQELFKAYYYNTINIICAVLKMDSEKIFKDPDNVSRITMCLDFLLNLDFENFLKWINESKRLYDDYYMDINDEKGGAATKGASQKKVANVDDFISFRHVKPYDPDNFDTTEEDAVHKETEKSKSDTNNNKKFINVLTGSEVRL